MCVVCGKPQRDREAHLINANEPILANLGKLKKEEEVHPVKKITEDEITNNEI